MSGSGYAIWRLRAGDPVSTAMFYIDWYTGMVSFLNTDRQMIVSRFQVLGKVNGTTTITNYDRTDEEDCYFQWHCTALVQVQPVTADDAM